MNAIARVSCSLVLCLLVFIPPVGAQTAGLSRPFKGLFGSGGDRAAVRHSADLFASLVQAYDDNLLAERSGIRPAGTELGGHFTMLLASGSYQWQGRRIQVGMTAASVARYYNQIGSLRSAGHSAGVGFSAQLPMRATLFVNQTMAYSPSFLYGLFPGEAESAPGAAVPIAPDYAAYDFASSSYGTTASVGRGLTRRGTLNVRAHYRTTEFSGSALRQDVTTYGVRAQFSRTVARNRDVRVAYRYRAGNFGGVGGDLVPEHGIETGFSFSRPLSATRRATFGFGLGSSFIEVPEGASGARLAGRHYRVVGDASAGYQFRRTWEVRAQYRRGLDFVAELAEPVFSDAFRGSIGGAVSRRASFSASAAYSSGSSAAYRQSSTFDTYTGTMQLQYGLGRFWAAYAQYLYYYYDFSGNPQLAPGRPPVLERNGVRVGLTLWAPVLRR